MADSLSSNPNNRRTPIILGLCALITAGILVVQWHEGLPLNGPLRDAENYVQDWFVRVGPKVPVDSRLVLIGIDRPAYDDVIRPEEAQADPVLAALRGRFPWSRKVWAALIERLANAGAKVIVIDLVFAAEADGDPELRAVLDKYSDRVVIGSNFSPVETDRGVLAKLTVPNAALIPEMPNQPAALDSRVGFVNIWPDDDEVFRRAKFRATNRELNDAVAAPPGTLLDSLDARALQKFGGPSTIPPGNQPQKLRFTGPPAGSFPLRSVVDVLTPKLWSANYANGEFFRDKLVLIGPTANIFQDAHRTPFRADMAGPEIHLNLINAALHGEFLRELSPWSVRGLIALAGLAAAALCRFLKQPVKRLVVILVLSLGYFFGVKWLFNHVNQVVIAVAPLLVLNAAGFAALAYDFVVERLERMKLRHTMGLYFSPRVLEAVLADPGSMEPRRADVTLLLTDLRNSTPLAESLGPKGMFELLNRVFEAQTNAIMGEEGNLEHFLGDQFLSYWGAPQPQPDAADRAERAALKLITAMEQLRATLSPEVQKLFGYGVALHSGGVLVGNKGSALRLDYGLVGDTVNEAARIEALTKYYGVKLLVSRDAFAQFSQQGVRRLLDRAIVKGKTEPVELYECENPCTPPNYPELCQRYKAAYDEYFFGRFPEAKSQFEKLGEDFSDGASRTLAARCAELAAAPPAGWKGIWKMEAK